MNNANIWERSHELHIQTGPDIVGGFSIGFDDDISEETKDTMSIGWKTITICR